MIKITEVKQSFVSPGIITPDECIFGSERTTSVLSGAPVLRPDGQWTKYIPIYEKQAKRGIETSACTVFGLLNCVETLFKEQFGLDVNYSDRFLAKLAGIDPYQGGGNPQVVAETARKVGFLDENKWTFDEAIRDLMDYYAPVPDDLKSLAKKWLKQWTFNHDWVSEGRPISPQILMKALKYSTLGIAVYAWAERDDGIFVRPENAKDIHFCEMIGYKENEYFIINDTYEPFVKHLDWNFGFYFVKRYAIAKNIKKQCKIISYFKSLFN